MTDRTFYVIARDQDGDTIVSGPYTYASARHEADVLALAGYRSGVTRAADGMTALANAEIAFGDTAKAA